MALLRDKMAEMARIKGELRRMEEDDTVTEEDSGDLRDTLVERWEQLDAECKPIIARMDKIRGITREGATPGNAEEGADLGLRGPEFMRHQDPFEDLDKVRQGVVKHSDLIARSLTAVEAHAKRGLLPDDNAQEATRKAQRNPLIARHMLLSGGDAYLDAFRAYLNDPTGAGLQEAQRSLTLVSNQGGYMLPYVLDPTIVLSNSGAANPYRQMSRIEQTTSNAWQGVNSAGVQAGWLDEGVASSDGFTGGVGQIQIYVKKGAAWVFGSFEALGDTNFGDQLPRLLADAKDITEEAGFAVGTGGSGNAGAPYGILTSISGTGQRVGAQSVGATGSFTGGAFSGTGSVPAQDIYNLQSALGARFRRKPSIGWLADIATINKARSLDVYGGSSFWANFGDDTPEQLLGKPIRESSSVPSAAAGTGTGTGNAIMVYGSWEDFIIVDRIGTSMIYEPLVKSSANATMPSGQSGWFYFWRSGSGVTTPAAFRFLTNG